MQLLGFFWTASQLVMVTGAGLELHSVHPSLQALRLDTTLPLQVRAASRRAWLLHTACVRLPQARTLHAAAWQASFPLLPPACCRWYKLPACLPRPHAAPAGRAVVCVQPPDADGGAGLWQQRCQAAGHPVQPHRWGQGQAVRRLVCAPACYVCFAAPPFPPFYSNPAGAPPAPQACCACRCWT